MLFTKLFELLPLAFVVAQKALVIHGGLWRHRGVTLSQMRKLAHRRQCPEAPQTYDDYIFFDLVSLCARSNGLFPRGVFL